MPLAIFCTCVTSENLAVSRIQIVGSKGKMYGAWRKKILGLEKSRDGAAKRAHVKRPVNYLVEACAKWNSESPSNAPWSFRSSCQDQTVLDLTLKFVPKEGYHRNRFPFILGLRCLSLYRIFLVRRGPLVKCSKLIFFLLQRNLRPASTHDPE